MSPIPTDYPIFLLECIMRGATKSVLIEIAAPSLFQAFIILQEHHPGAHVVKDHGIRQKGGTA